MSDDDKKAAPDPLPRNPMSTITVPPGSEYVELPHVPRAAAVPDILSAEQRALLEADPSAPRWALHLCGRFEETKADVESVHSHLDAVKTALGTDRTKHGEKIDQLIKTVTDLVNAYAAHEQQDFETFEAHEKRLNRQRSDTDDATQGLRKLTEKYDRMNDLAHENQSRLHKHDTRFTELEKRVTGLEQGLAGDGK